MHTVLVDCNGKMNMRLITKRTLLAFGTLVLLFGGALPALANAAQLNQAGVRLGRLSTNAGSGGAGDGNDLLVTFKLNTTPTSVSKVDVAFPTGFSVTTSTPTIGNSFPSTPGSITLPPGLTGGSSTATATAGTKDIMISGLTSASLDNTTLYGFTIPAGTVTNPGSTGQYNLTVCSGGSSLGAGCASNVIDSTSVPVSIVGANADQVTVNASVAANFSFSLSANSDTVPKADPTTIQTSPGITMTVATNSPLGYTAYVKSANSYLSSAGTPGTNITTGTFNGSPDAVSAGTASYTFVPSTGTAGSTACGSIAYDGEYNGIDSSHGGSFNGTNFASFEERSGYTSGDQISLKERVAVANTIAAANDYTDTLTIVAAGNF